MDDVTLCGYSVQYEWMIASCTLYSRGEKDWPEIAKTVREAMIGIQDAVLASRISSLDIGTLIADDLINIYGDLGWKAYCTRGGTQCDLGMPSYIEIAVSPAQLTQLQLMFG